MILNEIVSNKKEELKKTKKENNLNYLDNIIKNLPKPISFNTALKKDLGNKNRIIAEVKKASPSQGVIRKDFFPVEFAREYEKHGAIAVSVLTDEKYFMGKLEYLTVIKREVSIPVFRKDFIFDPYQIYESRAWGADALLLISTILQKEQLKELLQLVNELSLSAMVEVHTREELMIALDTNSSIIGINNRNLKTFQTNLQTTIEMLSDIPLEKTVISESGFTTIDDIAKLSHLGVDAFLIGESLMRAEKPADKLSEFVGY